MNYNTMLVAAALNALVEQAEGSWDSAKIVIDALHSIEPVKGAIIENKTTKNGSVTQGQTDLGNFGFQEEDEEVTNVWGVKFTRIGKWKIWRYDRSKESPISAIYFVHFLSQGVHDGSVRDREYILEYNDKLEPTGFGYQSEEKVLVFSFLFFKKYRTDIINIFGELTIKNVWGREISF